MLEITCFTRLGLLSENKTKIISQPIAAFSMLLIKFY